MPGGAPGGPAAATIRIAVQREDFDAAEAVARLAAGRHDIGGIVSFTGLCRDEGGMLDALELEHYPGMAEAELGRIAAEAATRWPLIGVTIIHRFGTLLPGARIVLVVCAAAHRRAAFEAADFLMDFLKSRAPFWKKEFRRDGSPAEWVAAKEDDAAAVHRW